jgi:hypothetical protein
VPKDVMNSLPTVAEGIRFINDAVIYIQPKPVVREHIIVSIVKYILYFRE